MDKLIHLILLSENLAIKGQATQSSTYLIWSAPHAIDGVRHGPDPDTVTYCSATGYEISPWWRLDLLDVYNINTVLITARSDGALDQTNGAEIRIGNSLENNGNKNPICAVTSDFQTSQTLTYSCHGMEGRYVNVVMTGRTSHLALCEVEVYDADNLAFNGTVTQSSIYFGHGAQFAVDGIRYGSHSPPYCSITSFESNPWLRLDLVNIYDISTVIITSRSDGYLDQTNGAEIRIGNSLENNGNDNPICAVVSGLLARHTVSFSCHGMEGRYVNVIIPGRTSHLTLCEVEVYGKRHRKTFFLRLKFSSSVDGAAESNSILHQLQSALASHISDFNLSWTQLPEKEEEPEEDGGRKCVVQPGNGSKTLRTGLSLNMPLFFATPSQSVIVWVINSNNITLNAYAMSQTTGISDIPTSNPEIMSGTALKSDMEPLNSQIEQP
ncbi:hypothetical protein IRJ41_023551 [Triplophysa rosa]|uniref:Fucolectin tachylectin-4 pentraxin-1 domain-containing protein n=1 Tax=Triplophysa rosa TaxID=992332 RepID=A0A9W7X6L5_TRIRA|nr:hypothetical protein IRJ41_023551 [Triplophysa rosa]